jgi:uncharacterized protein (UPF0212 family)
MISNMERAKEWLRREKQWRANNEPTDYIDIAISAIEKQIPKELIFIEGSHYAWECPNCMEVAHDDFCGKCGQHFKWEDAWNHRVREG